MADYKSLENKIRDIVARPWTKDPKQVHHKQQQIQKKIIDEEPDMLNNKALGIPDSVIEAAKQISKGKTEVDVNPQYKPDTKDPDDDDNKKMKGKSPAAMGIAAAKDDDNERKEYSDKGKKMPSRLTGIRKEELKGKQHKIDKNKNGKIDAHDFKLLRKEEVEEVDEVSSALLKRAMNKAGNKAMWLRSLGQNNPAFKKSYAQAKKFQAAGIEKEKKEKEAAKNTVKEDNEQIDEISRDLARRVIRKSSDEVKYGTPKKDRSKAVELAGKKAYSIPSKAKVPATEEIQFSDEELARIEEISSTFSEDAVQSAQKAAQQKMKAAQITAKATVQADKIKDQARKQTKNN